MALVAQVLLWRVAAAILKLPTEPVDTRTLINQGLDVALMVGVIWVVFRIVDVLAHVFERLADKTATRMDDQAVPLLRKTLKLVLALLGGLFIIQNLGYSVLSIVTGLGIGGLALALAAQDSVANFFGSVVLFTDAPFQVEDYVEVGGVTGTVEEVGFRTTRIRQDDSSLVSVPNRTFTATNITNYSERTGRLIRFDLGIAFPVASEDLQRFVDDVRALFVTVVNVQENGVEVHLADFMESHVVVRVRAITLSTKRDLFLETRQELMLGCLKLLEIAGLSLAHPPNRLVLESAGENGSREGTVVSA
jgi:MscS family membrane protein